MDCVLWYNVLCLRERPVQYFLIGVIMKDRYGNKWMKQCGLSLETFGWDVGWKAYIVRIFMNCHRIVFESWLSMQLWIAVTFRFQIFRWQFTMIAWRLLLQVDCFQVWRLIWWKKDFQKSEIVRLLMLLPIWILWKRGGVVFQNSCRLCRNMDCVNRNLLTWK